MTERTAAYRNDVPMDKLTDAAAVLHSAAKDYAAELDRAIEVLEVELNELRTMRAALTVTRGVAVSDAVRIATKFSTPEEKS